MERVFILSLFAKDDMFLWNNISTVINAFLRFYEKDDRSYETIFKLWWRWICSFMGKMGCPMEQYLNCG